MSPVGYDAIRKRLSSNLPFVNSAYGDNHDRAVLTPLSREDFVAEAISSGLAEATAHRLFSLGGGPDIVFRALIDAANEGDKDPIPRCISHLSDRLDKFLDHLIGSQASTQMEC
jgi:hypothetical protein